MAPSEEVLLAELVGSNWEKRRDAVNAIAADPALLAKHEAAIVKRLDDVTGMYGGARAEACFVLYSSGADDVWRSRFLR